MNTAPPSLVLDLLEWTGAAPRPYAEAIEIWRTSCPRLTVWEDAFEAGYVARRVSEGRGPSLELTERGRAWLRRERGVGEPARPHAPS